MILPEWRYIFASVVGTSHEKTTAPCQDSSDCRLFWDDDGNEVLVAVVSDGAGSAAHSDAGSALACALFMRDMEALFNGTSSVQDITPEFAEGWLSRFHSEIDSRAQCEGAKPREFACTLLAAVLDGTSAVFLQIGDGAIVIPSTERQGEYSVVFWPQQGEYANQTFFATDPEAFKQMAFLHVEHNVDEVALFSDGLQCLALHYETRTAHNPFFQPVFEWLRPAPPGQSQKLSSSLASFLSSKKVNEATDDDKTLILATRVGPPVEQPSTVKEDVSNLI